MIYTNEEIKKRAKKRKNIKKIICILVYIILIPLLVYNVSLITQSIVHPEKTPYFLGLRTYVIISGSMQPNLNIGDVIIIKYTEESQLQVDDIISYKEDQNVITHRIVDIENVENKVMYTTKGDNNNTKDYDKKNIENIEGKVIFKLPKVGYIIFFVQNKITIFIGFAGVYIYLLYNGVLNKRKEKRRIKRLVYERKKVKLEKNNKDT